MIFSITGILRAGFWHTCQPSTCYLNCEQFWGLLWDSGYVECYSTCNDDTIVVHCFPHCTCNSGGFYGYCDCHVDG